jgi:hypothetical protein
MRPFTVLAVGMLAALIATPSIAAAQSRDAPIPYDAGQSASPSFEGWYPNEDGTFSLSFGYFNRNYEQTLDIPIGPDNHFTPGAEDRGQPTHLLPRRHTGVFTVAVPADFGGRTLTWSLTVGDETFAVPGHLRPEWQIDALEEVTSGNRPPELSFDAASGERRIGQGPGGVRHALTASAGTPLTLTIRMRDDAVQKQSLQGRPSNRGLTWSKYRGPGAVEINEPTPAIAEDGLAATRVTFSEPGHYVLRALAWDDSGGQGMIMAGGFQCCWTNAYVDVRVE